jgi:hypothetical protein
VGTIGSDMVATVFIQCWIFNFAISLLFLSAFFLHFVVFGSFSKLGLFGKFLLSGVLFQYALLSFFAHCPFTNNCVFLSLGYTRHSPSWLEKCVYNQPFNMTHAKTAVLALSS